MDSRLRGNDGRFCKGLIKGEGDSVGWIVLFTRVTLPLLWIADQVRNDVWSYPAALHGIPRPVDTALKPV